MVVGERPAAEKNPGSVSHFDRNRRPRRDGRQDAAARAHARRALQAAAADRSRHFFATLANHALAAWLGAWITQMAGRDAMRWILGASFLAMAAWTLVPDRLENEEAGRVRLGVFGATLVAFFLVEMGDKTQVATVALAARYASIVAVVAGTTLGMMLANVPAVVLGERLLGRVPVKAVHRIAAAIFALLGALALVDPQFRRIFGDAR